METIGERIDQIIREKNLKKVQFAEKLGINQSYVTHLVKGKNLPSDALVKSICREFGVSEEWLRTGEGEMRRPFVSDTVDEIVKSNGLGPEDRKTLSEFIELPLESQKVLIDYLRNTLNRLDELMASELADEQRSSESPTNPQKTLTREQEADEVTGKIREAILSGGEKAPESGTPPDGVGIA